MNIIYATKFPVVMILKNEQEVVVDSPTFVCPGRK